MADEMETGAEAKTDQATGAVSTEDQGKEEAKELTADEVRLSIKEAIEENDKKWKARFDTLAEEKRKQEQEKETTEQKLERLERERAEERIANAIEKGLAKTGLSEEILEHVMNIASGDTSKILSGFENLASLMNAYVETKATEKFNAAIDEKQGRIKAPVGGQEVNVKAGEEEIAEAKKTGNLQKASTLFVQNILSKQQ